MKPLNQSMIQEDDEIDLLDLFNVLKAHAAWIVISALMMGCLALAYAMFMITPLYQASVRMIVNSRQDAYTTVTINDVATAENLVSTYAAVIKSNRVMDEVIETLELETDWVSLNRMVSVIPVDNTPVMDIVVTGTDPKLCREIVNTISEVAPEMIVDAVEAGSCKVISDAYCSGVPVSPNVKKYALCGMLAGACLAATWFMIRHLMNDGIGSEDMLADNAGIPVLSTIPMVEKNKFSAFLSQESPFALTEAYVRLRTNYIYTTRNGDYKKIVFTSCLPGEGKSTLVLNLAISLAKNGKKVLVIDCDLRKSCMAAYLGHSNVGQKGLSGILSNLEKAEDCILHLEQ